MKSEDILDALEWLLTEEERQRSQSETRRAEWNERWLSAKIGKLLELTRRNGDLYGYQLIERLR